MKVFIVSFPGVYLQGYATVVAHDRDEAKALLHEELDAALDGTGWRPDGAKARLKQRAKDEMEFVAELDLAEAHALVIWDGEY